MIKKGTHQRFPAYGYARVSTISQADNTSLYSQRCAIEQFAENNNYRLRGIFCEVGSGHGLNRAELLAAIRSLQEKETLLTTRPDRLSRDVKSALVILDYIHKKGAELHFTELSADLHSPSGRLLFTLMIATAEHEREMIYERTSTGRAIAAAEGRTLGGPSPYGSKRIGGRSERLDQEWFGMERIYRLHRLGYSLREIARTLTREGIKPKKSDTWSHSSIAKIIKRMKGTPDG